jgi:hypothetical protein
MSNRWPASKDIMSVYAVIAFLIQVWTIYVSFEQLPAWASFLNINELMAVLAYRVTESFIECLLILGILLVISFLLPPRFFRDVFIIRGSAFALGLLGPMILFWKLFRGDPGTVMADYARLWMVSSVFLASLASYLSVKVISVSDFLKWISDRMIVFLYLLIPMSLVGCITVLIRNMIQG